MFFKIKSRFILLSVLAFKITTATAQSYLPPFIEWHGKSESLIANSNNPWITPSEKSGFVTTPDYNETMNWFKNLATASPLLTMVSIGKSVEGRDVFMIIASAEKLGFNNDYVIPEELLKAKNTASNSSKLFNIIGQKF